MIGKFPMVPLTSNEEKVRKKLEKFPQGVKVRTLTTELYMGKTAVYEALNSLEVKELAFRGDHSLWYPNPPEKDAISIKESELALGHSQKLVPAFDNIMLCEFDSQNKLFRATEEHLRSGYPKIYQKFMKLWEAANEKNKEILQKHSQKLTNLKAGFINYEHHPFQLLQFLSIWKPEPRHVELRDKMLREVKPLFDIYCSLKEDLSLLKLKIEHGTPLKGKCFLCPKK